MNSQPVTPRLASTPADGVDADLQTVLTAWHDATVRWEQTHELLQAEVRRLAAALQAKRQPFVTGQREQNIGQIAVESARGIRGALAPASLYLNLLRRRVLDDPGAIELLHKAERSCAEADARVDDLLHLTMERPPMLRLVNLRVLINDVYHTLRTRLSVQGIATRMDVPEQATVLADYDMLRQAIYNLTVNALDAMPTGGELVMTSFSGPGAVELEIADSGTGLSDEARTRAFEPFFSTKNGSGLGLSVVRRLLGALGGDVAAMNCPEGGAAFTLRFPRRALEAAA